MQCRLKWFLSPDIPIFQFQFGSLTFQHVQKIMVDAVTLVPVLPEEEHVLVRRPILLP